jgi:transcription termination/antitermination protein NusG
MEVGAAGEGGEALLQCEQNRRDTCDHIGTGTVSAPWVVLWTQSHCERSVRDQLAATGYEVFLPTIRAWSRQRGPQRVIAVPMFPGYLFLQHALDKRSYVDVIKTRGLVRILGEAWDRPATVPGSEIDAIRRIAESDVPVFPHPYLRAGQRVVIRKGPLKDLEGVLVQSKPAKGLVVVSVELLRRSVAVEVDGLDVIPVGGGPAMHAEPRMRHFAGIA